MVRKSSSLFLLQVLLICVVSSQAAQGIVVRDDKFPHAIFLGFIVNPAIGQLSVGCTGTLVSPNEFLTAKHCTQFQSPGSMTVNFGHDSNAPDFSIGVVAKQEAGGGGLSSLLDGTDVSLLTLADDVPGSVATPLPIAGSTSSGMPVVTSGFGYNGTGTSGHGFTADDRRWTGMNFVDAYGQAFDEGGPVAGSANIFNTDFDNGAAVNNRLGYLGSSPAPSPWEATTAPGDSGGPLLAGVNGELSVIGVLSGGTSSTSQFGDISWWTGLDPYIDGNGNLDLSQVTSKGSPRLLGDMSQFARVPSAVPEPSAASILLSGALLVFSVLRCRRDQVR